LQFASGVTAELDDGSGYVDMSVAQWDKNPFNGGQQLKAPQLTIRTTVPLYRINTNVRDNINKKSSSVDQHSYYLSFKFDIKQNFSSNTTFPACTQYNTESKAFVVSCPGCSIASYTNYNVTYGCDDISRLLATTSQQNQRYRYLLSSSSSNSISSTDDVNTETSGDDESYSVTDDGGDDYFGGQQTSITSINYGALLSTFTSTLSGNPFAINFQQSKIIIFLVSSIFVTIVLGYLYYSRVDMMNRRKSMYTKVDKEICKKGDIDLSKDKFDNNDDKKKYYNNKSVVFDKLDINRNISTSYDNDDNNNNYNLKDNDDDLLLDVNTRMKFINDIIENDFIDKVFELEGFLSDEPFSLFKKNENDDKEEEDEEDEVDVTPQLNEWISFWIQILASIFVDTLFFSTFFPDSGECQTYTTEATCIIPMNNALNTPLCIWKAQQRERESTVGTCSLSPPPANVSFTFILVVLTVIVTIPIVMFLKRILYYAFLRPKLSLWGWSEEYWLGKIRRCFQ